MATPHNESVMNELDIHLDQLSSDERIQLVEEIFDSLTAQELRRVQELAEVKGKTKLEEAKAAVLEEMTEKFRELGLTLNDVLTPRRSRKSKSVLRVKYRSPDGETWSGRGHAPLWLRQLELQGHNRDEYKVTES